MHDRGATNRMAFNDRGAPTSGPAKRCRTSDQVPQLLAGARPWWRLSRGPTTIASREFPRALGAERRTWYAARTRAALCCLTFELTPTAEAGSVSLVRDDA